MRYISSFIILLAFISSVATVSAQLTNNREGKLDRSYGVNGLAAVWPGVGVEFGDAIALSTGETLHGYSYYTATQKVVYLVKQLPDGAVDIGFGNQGRAEIDVNEPGTNGVYLTSLTIQSDGRILVAGIAYKVTDVDGFLLRLHPSGSLDTSFGNQGFVRFSFAPSANVRSDDWLSKTLVDKQGRIVVLTLADQFPESGPGSGYCILTRLLPNGSSDATFGVDGSSKQTIGVRIPFYVLLEMADAGIQQDGKIVVGATSQRESTVSGVLYFQAVMLRYLDNGLLDLTFANDGSFDVPNWSYFYGLHMLSEGKILILGSGGLARLNANGSFDATFGINGRASVPDMNGNALLVASNNKIFVSGTIYVQGGSRAISRVRRFWADGTRDIRFGQGGQATIEMQGDFILRLFAIREDKYLIAACEIGNGSNPYSARLFATRKE